MNRRKFCSAATVGMALDLLSIRQVLAMDPVTLSLLLGLLSAWSMFITQKKAADITAQAQIETARMQLLWQKIQEESRIREQRRQYGLTTVVEEFLVNKDGREVKVTITKNIDTVGTEVGINGKFGSQRGNYGGTFTTSELNLFSLGISKGENMPVPVTDGYFSLSPSTEEKVKGMFGKNESPIAIRPYSSARTPTTDGWDLATILYANENNKMDAKIVQRKPQG